MGHPSGQICFCVNQMTSRLLSCRRDDRSESRDRRRRRSRSRSRGAGRRRSRSRERAERPERAERRRRSRSPRERERKREEREIKEEREYRPRDTHYGEGRCAARRARCAVNSRNCEFARTPGGERPVRWKKECGKEGLGGALPNDPELGRCVARTVPPSKLQSCSKTCSLPQFLGIRSRI